MPKSESLSETQKAPYPFPDERGRYGQFGGRFVPETLMHPLQELEEAFKGQVYSVAIKKTVKFPDSVIVTQEDFLEPPQSRSMLRFEPRSEHAEAYRTLAREVLP